jgi:hypothetical protein
MEIIDIDDIYDPVNVQKILVSVALFTLQSVLALIDTNTYIKDFGVADATDSIITKGRFYYSYFAGFMTFFLKLSVSLISLFILITVIRAGIVGIWNIMRPIKGTQEDEFRGSIYSLFKIAAKSNMLYILGIYHLEGFWRTFLIYSPIIILFITLGYALFVYERKALEETRDSEGDLPKVHSILNTLHHHHMFFIVIVVFILIFYTFGSYANKYYEIHPVD